MSIKTPMEIGYIDPAEVRDGHLERLDADIVWSFQDDFGHYLRAMRTERGLSLRKLSERVDVSHTYLVRLEAGDKAKAPPMELLVQLSEALSVDPREMLTRAGFLFRVRDDAGGQDLADLEFVAVVLSEELRPATLRPSALPYISPQLKLEWVEFARKLAHHPDPRGLLERLLREAREVEES